MSSKHTRYVRQIDAVRITNQAGTVVFSAGSGGGTPIQTQIAASEVFFSPAGNVQAGNVQGAIEELDQEKLGLDGGTMTGVLVLAAELPVSDLEAASKWYVDNLDHLLVPDAAGVPIARLLPDFVRIGHPLQPGLTWTMAQGVQLPAVCITELLDRFTTFIAAPTGAALATMGAVHHVPAATRLSTIAVAIGENTLGSDATLLVLSASAMADLDASDPTVVGRIAVTVGDRDIIGVAEDFVIDPDTGEFVTSGVNFVVTGDDPLLPAGSWLAVWDGTNMDFLTGVTVTIFGRRV